MEAKVTMTLDGIFDLVLSVLAANGLSRDQAEAIADIVTRAEADACRSHGLYRVEGYVAGLRAGRVNPAAQPRVRQVRPALLQVDGDRGFAPFAANLARPHLIAAARENGIAAMAMTRTHHFSALWADIEPLVEAGLVAWCFVVGQCSVAPHGGSAPLMGTNPIGFGWPRPDGAPFIFDFATSAAARGEVELKRLAGEPIPAGWGIDADGRPTRDPAEALSGALLPFGGHKGSALSMMVELIAGPLIGELTSKQVATLGHRDDGPPPGGELFIVFDPAALDGSAPAAAEGFFLDAKAQPGLRLPSERRYAARARSHASGVDVPSGLLRRIKALMPSPSA
ncbi:Ldh family oxidoreductase (plasmid) [Paracoccus pantotrophus]|uniref:Ldh family oxidoreductase n=2 Tax=Paracoccus pantotrophus TaxID=82367 RepID=A0A7H9BZZ5_PARPN|nr:Ldh family oxidoreductase [Paracoccus pantotrophus]RDD97940.1 Ldh family oxidoreductase [Paracoccus pantotrophus]RNI14326.1 Ldh family oxidoreductase [Paracoccus pantotrophus]WGR65901.1 Ldh family oxidoreductase [Paracoccus pantotrophus]SFO64537.1 Malate/lactate/ureidoglycolate dehydrogenase, LDH2 family [Paracoccus pantotrophus]